MGKYEGIMFWVKPVTAGPLATTGDGPGPYEDALVFACRRIMKDADALIPGGKPGNGMWPEVTNSKEILDANGSLRRRGLKDSEVGLWCGLVLHKNAQQKTMFCA